MAHPKFLVIGAQKSGTSWLHEMLRQHPGIFVPEMKEVHFFIRPEHSRFSRLDNGWDWYQALYQPYDGKATGDVTPDYIYWDYCAESIASQQPDAKIIAILRHPVDRAYSQYWMSRRNETHTLSFEICLEQHEALVNRGKYAEQLERFFARFPPENIRILFYEELFADPAPFVTELYRFLGVDDEFQPSGLDSAVGNTVVYPKRMGHFIYRRVSPIINHPWVLPAYRLLRYRTGLRDAFVDRFAVQSGYPEMEAGTRENLLEAFAPENLRLAELLGRPVPAEWAR